MNIHLVSKIGLDRYRNYDHMIKALSKRHYLLRKMTNNLSKILRKWEYSKEPQEA